MAQRSKALCCYCSSLLLPVGVGLNCISDTLSFCFETQCIANDWGWSGTCPCNGIPKRISDHLYLKTFFYL